MITEDDRYRRLRRESLEHRNNNHGNVSDHNISLSSNCEVPFEITKGRSLVSRQATSDLGGFGNFTSTFSLAPLALLVNG